jgi:large subunit ribosomal protein L16
LKRVEYWTAAVKRGRVMFEIAGVPRETAVEAFRTASFKLPIKVKLLTREGAGE